MREILFRGLRVDNDEWVEGFYIYDTLYQFDAINNGKGEFYRVRPETVGQFTGLTDKNGVKIFEGDIIVQQRYPYFDNGVPNYVSEVAWIYSAWEYVLHCINPLKSGISDGINERLDEGEEDENTTWEIIGNIHENKDLL